MDNNNINTRSSARPNTFGQVILRFVTSAIILAITAFFTPGFTISNVWALALAAVILTVVDYLLATFTGLHASAFGKGFVGFILAVAVLYVTQYFVAGYSISWVAAIIGALIYGVVDFFIPDQKLLTQDKVMETLPKLFKDLEFTKIESNKSA